MSSTSSPPSYKGVGNTFIAGLIESGKARAGLRHSFVMVAITYLTFSVVL